MSPHHNFGLGLECVPFLNEFGQVRIKITKRSSNAAVTTAEYKLQSCRRKLGASFAADITNSLLDLGIQPGRSFPVTTDAQLETVAPGFLVPLKEREVR